MGGEEDRGVHAQGQHSHAHSHGYPVPSLGLCPVPFDSSCFCRSTQQIQSCLNKMYLIYKQFKKSRMRPGEPLGSPPLLCGPPYRAAGAALRPVLWGAQRSRSKARSPLSHSLQAGG